MIHELENRLDNQWKNIRPTDDDYIIAFKNERFLLWNNEYPKATYFDKEKCIYLFKIEDNNFFLYTDENIPEIPNSSWEAVSIFRQKKLNKAFSYAGIVANHLVHWYSNSQYCGKCGTKTIHHDKERMMFCPHCKNMIFPKISPAVIVAVTDKDKLLMSKYAGKQDGKYILLAGYSEIGETLEETCIREVYEETGVHIHNLRYYKSQPWGLSGSLLVGYFAEADSTEPLTIDTNELSVASWVNRKDIDVVYDGFSLTNDMTIAFKEKKF